MNQRSQIVGVLFVVLGLMATGCSVSNAAVTTSGQGPIESAVELPPLQLPDSIPDNDAARWDVALLTRYERARAAGPVDLGAFSGLADQVCVGLATLSHAQGQLANNPTAQNELAQLAEVDCDLAFVEFSPTVSTAPTWDAMTEERFAETIGYMTSSEFAEVAVRVCESGLPFDLADRGRYSLSEAEQLSAIDQSGDCGLRTGEHQAPNTQVTATTKAGQPEEPPSAEAATFVAQPASSAAKWDAIVLAKYNEFEPTGIFLEKFAVLANGICLGLVTEEQLPTLFPGADELIDLLIELGETECENQAGWLDDGPGGPTGATTWNEMIDLRFAKAVPFRDKPSFEGLAERICIDSTIILIQDVFVSGSVERQLRAMQDAGECELPRSAGPAVANLGDVDGQWVMFTSTRDGDQDIYIMRPDGTQVAQLTYNDYFDGRALWSPDNTLVGYTVDPIDNSPSETRVMNADGSNDRPLSINREVDGRPNVSHDSRWIAWEHEGQLGEVVVESLATGARVVIADEQFSMSLGFMDLTNRWSPDDSLLLIDARHDVTNTTDLIVATPGDEGFTQLTFDMGAAEGAWSPDGTRIAFAADGENKTGDNIFVMNADGTNITQLTDLDGSAAGPKWSPDGETIAFRNSAEYGEGELYVVSADGGDVRALTSSGRGQVFWHEWSPDSQRLVYTHDDAGVWLFGDESDPETAMYLVDLDGTEVSLGQNGRPVAWRDVGDSAMPLAQDTATGSSTESAGHIVYSTTSTQESGSEEAAEIYSLDVASGQVTQLTDNDVAEYAVVMSPDGDQLTYSFYRGTDDESELAMVNSDGSDPKTLQGLDLYSEAGYLSPDGNLLFYVSAGWGYVMSLDGRNTDWTGIEAVQHTFSPWNDTVWSPDGETIAVGTGLTGLDLISVASGDIVTIGADIGFSGIEWSSDGSRIVFTESILVEESDDGTRGTYSSGISVIDVDGTNYEQLFVWPEGSASSAAQSPDGRFIVFFGNDGSERGLWIANADGSDARLLTDRVGFSGYHWSPDSSLVVFSDRAGALMTVDLSGAITELGVVGDPAGWHS